MGRFVLMLCAALALSGASAAQVFPPAASPAPEARDASWLAVLASGVQPMPMREPTWRIVLRPIVLDLRGPAPPEVRWTPLISEPPQVRRRRQRRDER